LRRFFASAVVLLLAGCSFAPRDVGYDHVFTLKSVAARAGGAPKDLGVIKLAYPRAPVELQTYRVAVIRGDGHKDYIAGARWNDFLPEILGPALQMTLKNSGAFSYVEPDDGGVVNTMAMHTQIDKFDVSYAEGDKQPVVEVVLAFNILKSDGTPVARFISARKVKARENSMGAISDAFQHAFAGVQNDVVARLGEKG
jgi:ABC-type uncharacterized transport system auxiliary subunit